MNLQSTPVKELRRRLDILMTEFHREHGLINNRMTWYVTSQSFLVIAMASAGQERSTLEFLKFVIPGVGLLLSIFTYASILAALAVQETLKEKRKKLVNDFTNKHPHKDDELAIWIEPWGIRDPGNQTTILGININVQNWGMYASRFIPIVLIIFWITVFVWQFI